MEHVEDLPRGLVKMQNHNLDEIDYEFLEKVDKVDKIDWLHKELMINFRIVLKEIRERLESNYSRLSERLLTYFLEASQDPDPKIRQYAMEGLEKIRNKYPELFEAHQ